MNLYEELDTLLDNICIDEDWGTTLSNDGWKIIIGNEDEDSDSYSTDVSWYTHFTAEKNNEVFSCYLSGSAQKEISYDRWVDTDCYIVEDYNIKKL